MPGAVSTHAQAGEVDASRIDPQGLFEVIDEFEDRLFGPPLLRGTLRRDEDEGKGGAFGNAFGRPVFRDQIDLAAPLAGTVEKDHERPSFARLLPYPAGRLRR